MRNWELRIRNSVVGLAHAFPIPNSQFLIWAAPLTTPVDRVWPAIGAPSATSAIAAAENPDTCNDRVIVASSWTNHKGHKGHKGKSSREKASLWSL